jgi:dTDP-4-dehydrorhamnose reductase
MRLLIVGAGGQLGATAVRRLASSHEVIARSSRELDVTRRRDVTAAIDAIKPDAVLNCSAYTNVDRAQEDPLNALAVNAWGPQALAAAAAAAGATLVHYSTDFVFDGSSTRPYTEIDEPNPQGTYAASKLLGEWLAAAEAPSHYVLRVESLFGGPHAKSSVDALLNAILTGQEARAFSDRVVTPSYVDDVVDATMRLLEQQAPSGLYHCVNSGMTTWLELTRELARLAGREDAHITAVKMTETPLKTPRPLFAALSNAKLAASGVHMPTWQNAVGRYVELRIRN